MARDVLELLAATSNGVFAVNLYQRIILWNQGAQRILGWRPADAVGRSCAKVIAGTYAPATEGDELSDQGEGCSGDCFVIQWARVGRLAPSHRVLTRTRAGRSRWLNMIHVLLPAEPSELSTLVHIFSDVTEDVRARETIDRLAYRVHLASNPQVASATEVIPADAGIADALTPRETEVLRLLSEGLSTRGVAEHLAITATTARNHIQRILAKLGVHTRLEAVAHTSRRSMLESPRGGAR